MAETTESNPPPARLRGDTTTLCGLLRAESSSIISLAFLSLAAARAQKPLACTIIRFALKLF